MGGGREEKGGKKLPEKFFLLLISVISAPCLFFLYVPKVFWVEGQMFLESKNRTCSETRQQQRAARHRRGRFGILTEQ